MRNERDPRCTQEKISCASNALTTYIIPSSGDQTFNALTLESGLQSKTGILVKKEFFLS